MGFPAVGLHPPLLTFLLTLTGLAVLIKTPFNQTYIFPGPIVAPCVRLAKLSVHMPRWWLYPPEPLDGGARQFPGRTLHICSWARLRAAYRVQRVTQTCCGHTGPIPGLQNPGLTTLYYFLISVSQIPTYARQLLDHRELCATCC